VGRAAEAVVARWIEAFNARDLAAMLACIDPKIEFHPLKLHGVADVYRGQRGVRRWFADVEQQRHDHVLRVQRVESIDDRTVLAAGSMAFPGLRAGSSFSALYEVPGALIIRARHYLSPVETLVGLGIVTAELEWPSRIT
jgi:hypothetical protein